MTLDEVLEIIEVIKFEIEGRDGSTMDVCDADALTAKVKALKDKV